jgi:glycogen debranching enzyme
MSTNPVALPDGARPSSTEDGSPAGPRRDPYYILAAAPLADEAARVLKQGDTFAVFDHFGDIRCVGMGEEGLYHEGTRFLSSLLLCLDDVRPLFLSSTVRDANDLLAVDLTNPDLFDAGRIVVPRGTLHLARIKFLWQGACYERFFVKNYGLAPVSTHLRLQFEADFADIFEVRGTHRPRRGQVLPPAIEENRVVLSYRGLDDVVRRSRLTWSVRPTALSAGEAQFVLTLPPHGEARFDLTIHCEGDGDRPVLDFEPALAATSGSSRATLAKGCAIHTSNEQCNAWLRRTWADLHMMTTETPEGLYPYAGVPWFSTPFGRDGIITALECLWIDPGLARGVLAYLAATQAREVIPEQDAEPGKILHETRRGEMAALGEIPFGRYYGSVDATPLFVMLAGAYYERTADRAFIESIWPNIEAALHWMDTYGDADRDSFIEYRRQSPRGLVQQGWKDSHDSVFHADGTLAEGPIALCEVQAYTFGAWRAAALLAGMLGQTVRAQQLMQQARVVQERFEEAFWCEDLSTYALALDGAKRRCAVRTSNAGHCLLTSLGSRERARRTARTLLAPESFSGWGVRTVASSEARYNPMSYHNGSVWPHDNALIAAGLARYGLKKEVLAILSGLFDASLYLDLHRLPELFCGFVRRSGEGPTLYPVACAPQAWSAASAFLLLQATLGMVVRASEPQVSFFYPLLPPSLREVEIRNLRVGEATVDLLLQGHGPDDVGINVLRREGDVEIRMVK